MGSRLPALTLVFLGVVALVAGLFVGCGAFFAWNGRRSVSVHEVTPGTPLTVSFDAKRNTRYVVGVQAVFDRAELPEKDGELVVEAQMPLVARIVDDSGEVVAQAVGWLDPREPPTTLIGRGARPPEARNAPDVVAERLVGPWSCMRDQRASLTIDLGPDRLAPDRPRVRATRAVVYDDSVPASIVAVLVSAAAGVAAILVGLVLLVRSGRRRRRHISPHARP